MKNKICIGFLDLETTGLSQADGHRIIEVAFLLYQYDQTTKIKIPLGKYIQRINPNRAIDAKAQSIHKISIDDLVGQPLWEDVVENVVKVLKKIDLLVCHNVEFDAPFIAGEILRVGGKLPDPELFCTMDMGRFATFDGFPPSLRKLCDCFGIYYDLSKAHGAEYDILLTSKCFFLGLERGVYILPEFDKLENAA